MDAYQREKSRSTMGGWGTGMVRGTARTLTVIGALLLVAGGLAGWLWPTMTPALPAAAAARTPLALLHLDVSGYLGADITALAVIIAVVIGFNATTLQIAGQAHSLALVRVILLSLTPFLLCWTLTTGVALLYFLLPPAYVGQLWQILLWFAAVVVLMVAYLWELPWRLSGQYIGLWAIRRLAACPIERWETLDSYAALQTAVAAASLRGDLGTVQAITSVLGRFLAGAHDFAAANDATYRHRRYRVLKNLLSGCVQNVAQAPNAVAYRLGFVQAGVLLQAIACGHQPTDPDHDLFTGVVRAARAAPERLNPLWTGTRHALCLGEHERPYLLSYWTGHRAWTSDDPRRVTLVADGLAWIHSAFWRELRTAWAAREADAEAVQMLDDLYRYIAHHLARRVLRERHHGGVLRLPDLPVTLLDRVHATVLRLWPEGVADATRVSVVNAYEERRAELLKLTEA
jgi:hypothetical protein